MGEKLHGVDGGISRRGRSGRKSGYVFKAESNLLIKLYIGWRKKGKRPSLTQKYFKVIWTIYLNGTQISLVDFGETRILHTQQKK